MANDSFKVRKSLNIEPQTAPTLDQAGDVGYSSTDGELQVRDASATRGVVTKDGTQTLTNKTIDGASNTVTNLPASAIGSGTLGETRGGTNQSTYTTGDTLYASASNTLSKLGIGAANQVLSAVGGVPAWSTVSGGISYISSNPNAEADDTGWVEYADAAGSSPVDGTGGSPNITWTRSTSAPLRGSANFLFTKDAADRQGEGVAFDFTINRADVGKPLAISFDYEIASGTYATGDLTVYLVQDPSGTPVVIQPSGYQVVGLASGVPGRQANCTFQTSGDTSITSYRLCIHVASTSASAYTVKFDNFFVGPEQRAYGSAITDWVSWTPTGSWSSNTTYTGRRRRVGDCEEFQAKVATSGAPTSASLTVNLPVTIDSAKINASPTTGEVLGSAVISDAGTRAYVGAVAYNSTTTVRVIHSESGNAGSVNQASPITFGASDEVDLHFVVPVVGYSSNTLMSADADTRVVACQAGGTTTGGASSGAIIIFGTRNFDTHGAYSTSTGRFTVPVPGTYRVSAALNASNAVVIYIYKNGSISTYIGNTNSSGVGTVGGLVQCNAGDIIDIRPSADIGGWSGSPASILNIERISGPAQIAASEVIAASYSTDAGQSFNTGSIDIINFEDKVFDTHGAVTVGASWKFTAPAPGIYRVSGMVLTESDSWTQGDLATLRLYKNGSQFRQLYYHRQENTYANDLTSLVGSALVSMVAGDYIDLRFTQNTGSAVVLSASGVHCYVDIERIGGVG